MYTFPFHVWNEIFVNENVPIHMFFVYKMTYEIFCKDGKDNTGDV